MEPSWLSASPLRQLPWAGVGTKYIAFRRPCPPLHPRQCLVGPYPQRSFVRRANHHPHRHPRLPRGVIGVVQGSRPRGARVRGATDPALGRTTGPLTTRTALDHAYPSASVLGATTDACWQMTALLTRPTALRCAKLHHCRSPPRRLLLAPHHLRYLPRALHPR